MNREPMFRPVEKARLGMSEPVAVAFSPVGANAEEMPERLRRHPLRARVLAGDIDTPAYAEFLAGLWTAYSAIEQRLFTFAPAEILELLPQFRASLILEDLATLKQPGILKPLIKASAHPPAIFSPGAAVGAIFALELIDLEAPAMVEALRDNPSVSQAVAFYEGCAAQCAWRWPIAERVARRASSDQTSGLIEGVRAVFDVLETAARTCRPERRSTHGRARPSLTCAA